MSDLLLPECFSELGEIIAPKFCQRLPSQSDSYRIFHGRGKCFPLFDWLNIDAFGSLILITVFKLPAGLTEDALQAGLCSVMELMRRADPALTSVLIQRRDLPSISLQALYGEIPPLWYAKRKGARFVLSFSQQNVGYFLDIEPLRVWLENNAANRSILNLFSYTCAFSVVAMLGGASSVINMDMSKKSLDRGRENHLLNGISVEKVKFFAHDILKSWGKIKKYGAYDIVIIDPPSFQKGSFIATADYAKILTKMDTLIAEQGVFVACLNAPEIAENEFKQWMAEHCTNFRLQESLARNEDCPDCESGKGLKMLVYKKYSY